MVSCTKQLAHFRCFLWSLRLKIFSKLFWVYPTYSHFCYLSRNFPHEYYLENRIIFMRRLIIIENTRVNLWYVKCRRVWSEIMQTYTVKMHERDVFDKYYWRQVGRITVCVESTPSVPLWSNKSCQNICDQLPSDVLNTARQTLKLNFDSFFLISKLLYQLT